MDDAGEADLSSLFCPLTVRGNNNDAYEGLQLSGRRSQVIT